MEKTVYITEEEREKCRKVIDVFEELYEIAYGASQRPVLRSKTAEMRS